MFAAPALVLTQVKTRGAALMGITGRLVDGDEETPHRWPRRRGKMEREGSRLWCNQPKIRPEGATCLCRQLYKGAPGRPASSLWLCSSSPALCPYLFTPSSSLCRAHMPSRGGGATPKQDQRVFGIWGKYYTTYTANPVTVHSRPTTRPSALARTVPCPGGGEDFTACSSPRAAW